jgi:long-chain acyl-CoA synthetase
MHQDRNLGPPVAFIGCDAAGTLPGLFRRRVLNSPDAVAYREYDRPTRTWRDHSWKSIDARVCPLMAAFARAGLKVGDRVAIALPNGTDWVVADLAALTLGLVVVPLYLHGSPADMAVALGHSEARLLVIDTAERWNAVASRMPASVPLQHVWVQDGNVAPEDGTVLPTPVAIVDVVRERSEATAPPLAPDAVATIIYTSGTTGQPKGTILTHYALLWNAEAVSRVIFPRPDDVFLSCLPLAHSFERTVGYYLPMMAGSTVAYARSIEHLKADFLAIRPTAFLGVPRLYERIFAAINDRSRQIPLARRILDLAVGVGWSRFEAAQGRGTMPGGWRTVLWLLIGRAIATRVRAVFGGRLRAAVSGGAPLPTEVASFFLAMGVPVVEGYGLTEAAPVVAANDLRDTVAGSVGRALPGIQLRIAEGGELIVHTPAAMKGYWKDAAASAKAIDKNGWLHTGDIAEIRNGRVYIRGRLNDAVVLATGEKVAPGGIEEAIARDALFKQAFVVGEGRPYLCAVVVLDQSQWSALAARLGLAVDRPNDGRARELLLRRIGASLRDYPQYAQIRAVHATFDAWTAGNGLLTPTLKVRRDRLERKYRSEISQLYAGHAVFGASAPPPP